MQSRNVMISHVTITLKSLELSSRNQITINNPIVDQNQVILQLIQISSSHLIMASVQSKTHSDTSID
jgi:hypothetical protein